MKKQMMKDLLCIRHMDTNTDMIINLGISYLNRNQKIKELKQKYPYAKFLMDLKISGEDFLNAKLAYDAGADIVSVLGVSDDEVIRNTLLIAQENNKEVLVDFVGVSDQQNRALDMELYGVHYLYTNQAIDMSEFKDLTLCDYDIRQYSYLLKQDELACFI